MKTLTFNEINSSAYGIFISGEGAFNAPSRDRSSIAIPGRNGELIIDNGRFKNVTVTYPAFFYTSFLDNVADVREWLLSPKGYVKLYDDYNTDEYRLAVFNGKLEFEPTVANHHAQFDITFDCKPQRYLTSGDIAVTVASGGTLVNPTGFYALPLITISGTGDAELSVNGTTVSLTDLNGGIVLDSDMQDAYYGILSANDKMSGDFPVLSAGTNTVTYTGGITSVSITPRWWRV